MSTADTIYKLPEGWIWTTIPELFIIIGGGTPSKNNISFWNGDINWASVKDIKSKYLTDTIDKISKVGLEYSSTNIANKGDIVLVTRISPGQASIVKIPTAVNQDLKILKIFGSIPDEFVYYLLCYNKNNFIKHSSGTTVKGLKINDLKEIKLPLPPLAEQHRIVSKIEELFSELDHAEVGLIKAQKQLEVYRQALLKSAFEGKLTGNWRKTYKGEDYKWEKWNISKIGTVKGGKRLPKNVTYSEDKTQFPYLRVTDFNNYSISQINLKYITKETKNTLSNYAISKNDVYLSIAGTIGLSGIVPNSLDSSILTENAAKIIPNKGVFNKYLAYALSSPAIQIQIREKTKATSQPKLALYSINTIKLDLPDLEEQKLIVQEIESRFSLLEHLLSSISMSLRKIDFFRHSALRKAFRGQLVPQFSQEESAKVLLNKIKVEKGIYIIQQKTLEKQKPKHIKPMEPSKSILEVLQESKEPISAKELWLNSKHKDNIEDFYDELKDIYSLVKEVRKDMQSIISLKI